VRRAKTIGVALLLCVGCSKSTPAPEVKRPAADKTAAKPAAPVQPAAVPVAATPTPPKPVAPAVKPAIVPPIDPRVEEFKSEMRAFIKQAMSLVRYCEQVPEAKLCKAKHEAVVDAFTHVSEPPGGYEDLYAMAKQVQANLGAGALYAKYMEDGLRLGSKDLAEKAVASEKQLAETERARLKQIQTALDK
jgi:hypothetical protein